MNLKYKYKHILLLLFSITLLSSIKGQILSDNLLPIEVNNKFGYIDPSGTIVIEPQYKWASNFSEGLAVVRMHEEGEKYGFIDSTGTLIINPIYNAASNFSQGWARVKLGYEGFFYINKQGEQVLDSIFFECYNVQNFPIPVRESRYSKAGYIDKNGQYVIEPIYDVARPFINGYAVVGIKQQQGYINQAGAFIIKPQFYRANYFQNSIARVIVKDEKTGDKKEGFIDKQGEYIIPPSFEVGFAMDFSEGLTAVSSDGENWGFINTEGEIIIPAIFEKASSFSEGLAKVKYDGKYGFINTEGEWIIPPKYENVSNFKNGIASVYQKNERMGYLDKNADFIWRAKRPKKKVKEESPYDRY